MIDATSKLGRETFEFDPASNLLDKNAFDDGYASTETKRQPHIVDNIVKQYLDSKYEYDAFGQLIQQNNSTTQGTLRLEWDVFGRMVKSRNGQHTAQYRYDALGRRIAKTTTQHHTGQSQSTVYGWDGDTLAYESTDQKTTHYVYEKDSFVPLLQINYDQAVNLHTTPQWNKGEPYNIYADPLFNSTQSAVDLTRIYYYHCDHLGTPQELSNSMAQVVWQGQYKVWGKLKTPSVQQLIENSEIITNNLRFQGQYFDLETGLHYNRYRYYSPEVGRFISKDPIGLLGGLNGYAYAPNPVSWVDPLGLTSCPNKKGFSDKDIYEKRLKEINLEIATHDYTNRPNANLKVSGGVSGSIIYTKETGLKVGGSDHVQKGRNMLKSLKKTLKMVDNAYSLCDQDKAKLHALADPYVKKLEEALALPVKVKPTGESI